MPDGAFEEKRVLVIGGETQLGRAVAVGLAEAGADVAIASLTAEKGAEFAVNSALNELWAMGRKGVALIIDASDEDEVRESAARAEQELGRFDVVVVASGGKDVALGALGEREVLALPDDIDAEAAVSMVRERLGVEERGTRN